MNNRRNFLKKSALASLGLISLPGILKGKYGEVPVDPPGKIKPVVISTWRHGLSANEKAWQVLQEGGTALDAAEKGVMVVEADPDSQSVGLGGLPDRDGIVTLDACIMDEKGNCGSVCFLEEIMHPVAVARMVMEKTPHVMLSGEGAQALALANGMKKTNLLTEASRQAWLEWKKEARYKSEANWENHDTIGMIVMDAGGRLAGACTTSGMAYKMHGRVGDSPIIGAGLFVDGEVGAAVATGHGEYVMRTLGSFLVVELMRQGKTPEEACREALKRIAGQTSGREEIQIGFLAMNLKGETAACSLRKGFNYALIMDGENKLEDASFIR